MALAMNMTALSGVSASVMPLRVHSLSLPADASIARSAALTLINVRNYQTTD
jgi:hypothetical protein